MLDSGRPSALSRDKRRCESACRQRRWAAVRLPKPVFRSYRLMCGAMVFIEAPSALAHVEYSTICVCVCVRCSLAHRSASPLRTFADFTQIMHLVCTRSRVYAAAHAHTHACFGAGRFWVGRARYSGSSSANEHNIYIPHRPALPPGRQAVWNTKPHISNTSFGVLRFALAASV